MGGAYSNCYSKLIEYEKVPMACSTGRFDTNKAVFGVMSKDMPRKYYCTEEAIWEIPDN